MLSVALPLAGIVLFNSFIALIGQAAISSFLYTLIFTYILPSDVHKKQKALKKDIVDGRRELQSISAQDEFSRWAKVRRRVDKQVNELEALNTSLTSHRGSFNTVIKVLLFILTTGLQWSFSARYSRDAVVYLPKDWFGPLTWFLGLPFAPAGALSCGIYIMLIKRVIGILTRITTDIYSGVRGQPSETPPVAVPVSAHTSSEKAAPSKEKKTQ
ncbi:hypothetical protein P389DRAFT_168606 [Cystobasidium minutum MCA 4210]|uniref:uncharacterized protein n=1 Tax=Cystobasidium minutum MCA 4210 TaxID=1397322 RepID=UPI0034CFA318|eukprot:jgi/Rhomi1/168606/fgenesh1_kg.3_\